MQSPSPRCLQTAQTHPPQRRWYIKLALLSALSVGIENAIAAPVDSGALSISVPFSNDGVYLNLISGATGASAAAVTGWDTNPFFQGTAQPATANFAVFTSAIGDPERATLRSSQGGLSLLAPGSTVDFNAQFSTGSLGGPAFTNIGSRYYGVRFTNETTGARNYGYVLISTTAGLPTPATRIVRTGYCNAGEAVTVPAVPGPPLCGVRRIGFVYALLSNVASENQLYGYSINDATGVLTPIPGVNPLPTGGTGTMRNEELLAFDPAKGRLFAANDGSKTISAYSVNPATGALVALPYHPINTDLTSIATIKLHPSGSPLLIGAAGSIASINLTETTAIAAVGSPFSQTSASRSSTFSRDGNYYYTGGGNNFGLSGYTVNAANGVLTELSGSAFNLGPFLIALSTDVSGRLFGVNRGITLSGIFFPVSGFSTQAGVPGIIPVAQLASALVSPIHGQLSRSGSLYAVADNEANQVGVFRVAGSGSATMVLPVAGSPFTTGGMKTCSVAFNTDETHLYAANCQSRNITRFIVDSASGVLSSPLTQVTNTIGTTGQIVGMAFVTSDRHFANGFE